MTLVDAAGGRGAAPVAVTASGVVWFASYVSNTVVRLDVGGMRQDAFRMPAGVEGPKAIAIDGMGRVWVTAFRSARVARFDPRRKDWSAWATGDGSKPYGLSADGQGAMLVTDTGRNQLLRVDAATGSVMKVADLSDRGGSARRRAPRLEPVDRGAGRRPHRRGGCGRGALAVSGRAVSAARRQFSAARGSARWRSRARS